MDNSRPSSPAQIPLGVRQASTPKSNRTQRRRLSTGADESPSKCKRPRLEEEEEPVLTQSTTNARDDPPAESSVLKPKVNTRIALNLPPCIVCNSEDSATAVVQGDGSTTAICAVCFIVRQIEDLDLRVLGEYEEREVLDSVVRKLGGLAKSDYKSRVCLPNFSSQDAWKALQQKDVLRLSAYECATQAEQKAQIEDLLHQLTLIIITRLTAAAAVPSYPRLTGTTVEVIHSTIELLKQECCVASGIWLEPSKASYDDARIALKAMREHASAWTDHVLLKQLQTREQGLLKVANVKIFDTEEEAHELILTDIMSNLTITNEQLNPDQKRNMLGIFAQFYLLSCFLLSNRIPAENLSQSIESNGKNKKKITRPSKQKQKEKAELRDETETEDDSHQRDKAKGRQKKAATKQARKRASTDAGDVEDAHDIEEDEFHLDEDDLAKIRSSARTCSMYKNGAKKLQNGWGKKHLLAFCKADKITFKISFTVAVLVGLIEEKYKTEAGDKGESSAGKADSPAQQEDVEMAEPSRQKAIPSSPPKLSAGLSTAIGFVTERVKTAPGNTMVLETLREEFIQGFQQNTPALTTKPDLFDALLQELDKRKEWSREIITSKRLDRVALKFHPDMIAHTKDIPRTRRAAAKARSIQPEYKEASGEDSSDG